MVKIVIVKMGSLILEFLNVHNVNINVVLVIQKLITAKLVQRIAEI